MKQLEINKSLIPKETLEKGFFETVKAVDEMVEYGLGIGTLFQLTQLLRTNIVTSTNGYMKYFLIQKLGEHCCDVCGKDVGALEKVIFRVKLSAKNAVERSMDPECFSLVHFGPCDDIRLLRNVL